jgi:Peptidase family M48.
MCCLLWLPQSAVAQDEKLANEKSYSALIQERLAKRKEKNSDEVADALEIIGANKADLSASEITAHIKRELPSIDRHAPIRVLDEVLSRLVREGDDYKRLQATLRPLFQFLEVEGLVHPVLFRSEVPVVAVSPPNAVMVSTRTLHLLTKEELQAVVAHEICHLVVADIFRKAVDAKDYRTLRIIELVCDAGAVAILLARGCHPHDLVNGLAKMQQVLEIEFGEQGSKGRHPTIGTRGSLVKQLCRLMRERAG